ncbi:MAG: FlgD immunoglobulin-like domain containing protein [bacterium]|nr:FlgD immunoglobulin-like domain containing protein [bacterium]
MVDHEGPLINIGFQGQKFFDGGVVGKNAILEVEIADSVSGVNIVGEIGHHITMVLDDQESNPILLTDYFNYYENNHKAGLIIYDFGAHQFGDSFGLPEGEHKITIKAWDNFNNSSIVSVNFSVVADDVLEITNLFNFPNPFSSNTTFTFAVNHDCDVKIKIYTVRGTLIQTLEAPSLTGGYNQIFWDGRDRDGDQIANGVYLYKVIAKKQQLDRTLSREKIGKLVMAR